jgi:hypothetical protein
MAVNKVVYGTTVLVDMTDATASADQILEGYTAYGADGTKLVGTASGETMVISDTVDEHGGTIREITSKKVINLQPKEITPTAVKQIIGPDEGYAGLSQVIVNAAEGEKINNQNKTVAPTDSQQTVTADSGYTGLGTVTVEAIPSSYGRIEWDGATLMVY